MRKYETKWTKETGLKIAKVFDNDYRHVDGETGMTIGPHYASKYEAFIDHDNYVKQYMGWK